MPVESHGGSAPASSCPTNRVGRAASRGRHLLADAGSAAQSHDGADTLIELAAEQFGTVTYDNVATADRLDAADALDRLRRLICDALNGNITEHGATWARMIADDGRRVLVVAGGTRADDTIARADEFGFLHVVGVTLAPGA